MGNTPIGVAVSGGVDSTACALLLRQDHSVTGFLMDIGLPDFATQKGRVKEIGRAIGIAIEVVDLKASFKRLVLDYFTSSYFAGITPNPCLICNHSIKFGLLLDTILAAGFHGMATGHYARTERIGDEIALLRGNDPTKDQSYFLARLSREQLSRVLFPLGMKKKAQIYEFVAQSGFDFSQEQESQDICFLKERTLASFLQAHPSCPVGRGAIVTRNGTSIGEHNGLYRYTVGQRRGLGLPSHAPWYVHSLDIANNRLIVGRAADLFSRRLVARNARWLTTTPPVHTLLTAKIRASHRGAETSLLSCNGDSFELLFTEPQKAVTPGQFVVLYVGDRVVGSGEIVSSHHE